MAYLRGQLEALQGYFRIIANHYDDLNGEYKFESARKENLIKQVEAMAFMFGKRFADQFLLSERGMEELRSLWTRFRTLEPALAEDLQGLAADEEKYRSLQVQFELLLENFKHLRAECMDTFHKHAADVCIKQIENINQKHSRLETLTAHFREVREEYCKLLLNRS
ncbi:hypothetical protein A3D88_00430 [Candidatus Peribacteria bacterium RIFCSPHIGHO2_02_FULL_52_16]|nr:MAG: hypothetical protein A2706_01495 [Candidatus Peribacteria bacterium RIFCSPHIGHO2_01_FULL_51_35]OGJ61941.1 MAG: hypothetical protein A3D88_00430 [Candidatus Peribacteria bacterium RIFCSPHIGHO2_02_FULL_52_16]